MIRKMLDGNGAAVEALKLAKVKVISAYPITPQSPIAEKLSNLVVTNKLAAKYVRVESEHSALSCAIGAQLTGVRAATATSSVGLALMHEMLGVASGCRIPLVMPLVNRALVSPWSLWCDHQDSMSERDSGWLQFYAESVQEILDLLILAYKVAEHDEILLPVMVCFDGFFLSHSVQPIEVPEEDIVDQFLQPYRSKNLYLDPQDPMFINNLTPPDEFSEMRYQQMQAFKRALKVIPFILQKFITFFGRTYELVEDYRCEDADTVLVSLGSMSGTAKYVVDQLRKEGKKVGVIKIISFRPFPVEKIREFAKGKKIIGVLDRSPGLGAQGGPVWLEVCAALADMNISIFSYIAGLGGRDITEITIKKIFEELLNKTVKNENKTLNSWIDTDKNALNIRRVKQNV
ncbi:MAG: transketolase C-terminal domain-containing protein [Candidatus Thorarchaeota archaeon]